VIDLYYWPTPNGRNITLFLEETDMPYTIIPVNVGKGVPPLCVPMSAARRSASSNVDVH
jgi:glutathione S-transferase